MTNGEKAAKISEWMSLTDGIITLRNGHHLTGKRVEYELAQCFDIIEKYYSHQDGGPTKVSEEIAPVLTNHGDVARASAHDEKSTIADCADSSATGKR